MTLHMQPTGRSLSGRPVQGRAGGLAALATALLVSALFTHAPPAAAMQILEAADHAELRASVSATAVSRIALSDDRIARVVRSPDGFEVEHDAKRGDLYLRPRTGVAAADETILFLGTEKGFTYRLTLAVSKRDSAQILIRNADAATTREDHARDGDPRIAGLVKVVRAVARREPLPGYAIAAGAPANPGAYDRIVETWQGPAFTALVIETPDDGAEDAASLAARFAPGVAAAWLSGPGTGPNGGRLAVIVRERAGDVR